MLRLWFFFCLYESQTYQYDALVSNTALVFGLYLANLKLEYLTKNKYSIKEFRGGIGVLTTNFPRKKKNRTETGMKIPCPSMTFHIARSSNCAFDTFKVAVYFFQVNSILTSSMSMLTGFFPPDEVSYSLRLLQPNTDSSISVGK